MRNAAIRLSMAVCAALLPACVTACQPPIPLLSRGPVVEEVFFSPPEPFNGDTYVVVTGTLPDSCTEIDGVDHSYEDATVRVDITMAQSGDKECARGAVPFRETIRVRTGNLYPGTTYTVIVNGKRFTFPWDMEFEAPLTPDPGS